MISCIYIYIRGERVILSHRIRGILENVFSRRREQRFYMLGTMRLCWNLQLPPPCKFDDFWGGIVALAKPVVSRRRERRFRCVTKIHEFDFSFFLSHALGAKIQVCLRCCAFSPFCLIPLPIWDAFWCILPVLGHILGHILVHPTRNRPQARYKKNENEKWKFTFRVGENAHFQKQSNLRGGAHCIFPVWIWLFPRRGVLEIRCVRQNHLRTPYVYLSFSLLCVT